ncbi:hypothetical protein [Thalassospira marina]|uniref:hypothetical protein n=1 Tax=Thalassospira marina TaxID=2048283 RepID=UPI0010565427|nr:hypothetical protein [Thalassospira marina]
MSMIITQLRAWAPMVSSGYEVPAAGQVMLNAAAEIEAKDALIAELVGALEGAISAWETHYPKFPDDQTVEDSEFNEFWKARSVLAKAKAGGVS